MSATCYDQYDRHVIEEIERRGLEEVTLAELQELFRAANIRRRATLRRRCRDLVTHGPFERVGTQRWAYLPLASA